MKNNDKKYCKICGKEIDKNATGIYSDICDDKECFTKSFWIDILQKPHNRIIINRVCYYIERNNEKYKQYNGYGGHEFTIKYLDNNKIVKTNNLWCVGRIPKEFELLFINNAKFIYK